MSGRGGWNWRRKWRKPLKTFFCSFPEFSWKRFAKALKTFPSVCSAINSALFYENSIGTVRVPCRLKCLIIEINKENPSEFRRESENLWVFFWEIPNWIQSMEYEIHNRINLNHKRLTTSEIRWFFRFIHNSIAAEPKIIQWENSQWNFKLNLKRIETIIFPRIFLTIKTKYN